MAESKGKVHGAPLEVPSRSGEPAMEVEGEIDLNITAVNLKIAGVPLGKIRFLPGRFGDRLLAFLQGGPEALKALPEHPIANDRLIDLRPNLPTDQQDGDQPQGGDQGQGAGDAGAGSDVGGEKK